MLSYLKEEYSTLKELGADVIAIGVDTLDSHAAFDESMGRWPFPLASDLDLKVASLYDTVDETGQRAVRAIYVLDESRTILHRIPWYQPGNTGQFMEIFQSLGLE